MWIKKEEFYKKDNKNFYIMINCISDGCSYTIKASGNNTIIFGDDFVYSYLVGENNKEMIFDIIKIGGTYLTISLDGSPNVYGDGISYKTEENITSFNIDKNIIIECPKLTRVIIKGADIGEYITISVHSHFSYYTPYIAIPNTGLIEYNGPEIIGYLDRDIMDKECFPFYTSYYRYYLVGKVQTKYADLYYEDEEVMYTMGISDEGQIFISMGNEDTNLFYICLEFMYVLSDREYTANKTIFSLSILDPTKQNDLYNFYPPQAIGKVYERIIFKGNITFFSGMKNNNTVPKYFNLYQKKGKSQMYIANCIAYPDCHYSEYQLKNLIKIKNVNQIT